MDNKINFIDVRSRRADRRFSNYPAVSRPQGFATHSPRLRTRYRVQNAQDRALKGNNTEASLMRYATRVQ